MCLCCAYHGKQTKKDKEELFKYGRHKCYVHTQDNRLIKLNDKQIQEIINEAYYVLATSVDMSIDIWAIQWDRDYKVKTIKL